MLRRYTGLIIRRGAPWVMQLREFLGHAARRDVVGAAALAANQRACDRVENYLLFSPKQPGEEASDTMEEAGRGLMCFWIRYGCDGRPHSY